MGLPNEIAQYSRWKKRAEELYEEGKIKPSGWDCDVRREIIFKEMEQAGLIPGKDFVVVYADVGGRRHTFLELFGKTTKEYKLNGYRIDPADPKGALKIKNLWKADYQ